MDTKHDVSLMPTTFTVETALACNLRCPECAIGGDMIDRAKNLMSFDKFKIIADKVRPYAKYMYLHLWGEPMLNKRIIDMIGYVSSFSRSNISTNALLLTKEKSEQLITSGVSDLIVSIDGVSQDVYAKYRVGGEVEKAFQALEWLQKANVRHGNRVQISPQFIVFKHNQHEVALFRERVQRLGLNPVFKAPYIRNGASEFEKPDDPSLRRLEYDDLLSLRAAMSSCDNARSVFTMLSDGTVVACCHDFNRFTNFGNIFESDVPTIWNSPEYRAFRGDLMCGNASSYCIEKCMTWTPSARLAKELEGNIIAEPTPAKIKIGRVPSPLTAEETVKEEKLVQVNLCCGSSRVEGWVHVDISPHADIVVDLETTLLPFADQSVDTIVCMSAINYFSKQRAKEILADVRRVLKPGGIVRCGVQDLRVLAKKYLDNDSSFWDQKLADGSPRFPGETYADKFNNFFNGFETEGKRCRYVYDAETLVAMLKEVGFSSIETCSYRESKIRNIDQLDNRPDQMFFVEGIAKSVELLAAPNAHAPKIPTYLQPEVQWQEVIKDFHTIGFNRDSAMRASILALQHGEVEAGGRILKEYRAKIENDWEIETSIIEIEQHLPPINTAQISNVPLLVRSLNSPSAAVDDDRYHLGRALQWLVGAHGVRNRGVASMFYLNTWQWGHDYPETTGYIIPTFLASFALLKDTSEVPAVESLGIWEQAIQHPEGGVGEPVGVYDQLPRIFNTSQVMLGWLSLYEQTKKEEYLRSAERAAEWICSKQDPDGRWVNNCYRGPRSYHIRTAWALLELNRIAPKAYLYDAAIKHIKWVMTLVDNRGWIAETSLSDPARPWTHLLAYTLVGMLKVRPLIKDEQLRERLKQVCILARDALIAEYHHRQRSLHSVYKGFSGTYGAGWSGGDTWSCLTGDAQLCFFLYDAAELDGNFGSREVALLCREELKKVQIDAPNYPELHGAIAGSYPVDGGYCAYSIPNWAAKFFSDALLQPHLGVEQTRYLG